MSGPPRDVTRILDGREVYLETGPVGDFVRSTAIDAASGVEAIASGPLTAAPNDIERLALGKLARALIRAGVVEAPRPPQSPAGGGGRGILA